MVTDHKSALAKDLERLVGRSVWRRMRLRLPLMLEIVGFASRLPDVVVHAACTEDVSKVLEYANRHGISVTLVGWCGLHLSEDACRYAAGFVLSVAGTQRIKEIHVEDGVAAGGAGGDYRQVAGGSRKLGLFYPPDPASLKECSIGGDLATNAGRSPLI